VPYLSSKEGRKQGIEEDLGFKADRHRSRIGSELSPGALVGHHLGIGPLLTSRHQLSYVLMYEDDPDT
jgi:hypothetical protein